MGRKSWAKVRQLYGTAESKDVEWRLTQLQYEGDSWALGIAQDAVQAQWWRQDQERRAVAQKAAEKARNKVRYAQAQFGTDSALQANGFTAEQIEEVKKVSKCQFPGCSNERTVWGGGGAGKSRALCRDHAHAEPCETSHKINGPCPECFRGVICGGCNFRLATLDAHPEWANILELLYMSRRPFASRFWDDWVNQDPSLVVAPK